MGSQGTLRGDGSNVKHKTTTINIVIMMVIITLFNW